MGRGRWGQVATGLGGGHLAQTSERKMKGVGPGGDVRGAVRGNISGEI